MTQEAGSPAAGSEAGRLWLEYWPLEELLRAPRNPKDHDIGLLHGLMDHFGYTQPVLIDERTGRLVAGHGRLDTLGQKVRGGQAPPDYVVVAENGTWLVPVIRGWRSRSDADAEAYLVADNEATIRGGYKTDELIEVLEAAREAGTLEHTGRDEEDLARLYFDRDRGLDAEGSGRGAQDRGAGSGEGGGGGSAGDFSGMLPGGDRYREQYGVIVICSDEDHQEEVYERLKEEGYEVTVMDRRG